MYLFVDESVHNKCYQYTGSNEYAFCTCGEKFKLPKRPDASVLWSEDSSLRYDLSTVCPHCGAVYGNLSIRVYRREDYVCYKQGSEKRKKWPLYRMKSSGDTVSLIKEIGPADWISLADKGEPVSVTQVSVDFDTAHGLRLEGIRVNEKELTLNASNVQKAGACLNANMLPDVKGTERVKEELQWIQKTIDSTSSLGLALKMLWKYPVLDTLYERYQREQCDAPAYFFMGAISKLGIKEGERSIKKAFRLPTPMMELVCKNKVQFSIASEAVLKYGSQLGTEVVRCACEIVMGQENIKTLSFFLGTRTPAERNRLKSYLTEEVCIYQGIENPDAAWGLLKDYIHMCENMGVEYELCPKSLKLRHDLAARNQRLVLEELEREKFRAVVAKPDYARLAWTSNDGKWAVLVPREAGDLIHEGAELSHCVGSYVKYVTEGEKKICFLRKTEDLNKSLLTLTVNKECHCSTYLGFDNRYAQPDELAALREWTKARKLVLDEY